MGSPGVEVCSSGDTIPNSVKLSVVSPELGTAPTRVTLNQRRI